MDTSPTAPPTVVDCLGEACPLPVINLAKAFATLEVGDVVVVLADDPGAKVDIPVWCRMKQQELVAAAPREEGGWRFEIRRVR
jgi:tRNA 2-thiouridine synthesizing protein A